MQINTTNAVDRQLAKLRRQPKLIAKLQRAFRSISENPFAGKPLEGVHDGLHSWRVGDYRIIYKIFQNELIILVLNVADRREAYR